jgi:hypothetical protein
LARFALNTARSAAVTEPGLSAVRLSSFSLTAHFIRAIFDLVASNEAVLSEILLKHGFQDEKGQGRAGSVLHVGWMHPDHPDLGWQLVTGPLFDGRSDKSRGIAIELKPDSELTLPAWEDLIADRLSQFAAQDGKSHHELVEQARLLFRLASEIDHDYLKHRVTEDGGDLSLLFG